MTNVGYVGSTERHHLLSGCKKLAGTEYIKQHNNTLKMLAVKWATENGMLPKDTKWDATKWERGKVIEKDGKKLFWDWEHPTRTDSIALDQILHWKINQRKQYY